MAIGKSSKPSAVERRRTVHELRMANNGWDTIARVTGLKESSCKMYLKAAIDIDGLPPIHPIAERGAAVNEVAVPEILALASDPFDQKFEQLRLACRQAGMKPTMVAAILRRLKTQFAAPYEEAKRLTLKQMTDQINEKIGLVLSAMDEYSVAGAPLRDQSIALGILVDRHQLLSGAPTQIIDVTARMQLQQLLPAVLAEAQRRGMTIDVPMVEVVK